MGMATPTTGDQIHDQPNTNSTAMIIKELAKSTRYRTEATLAEKMAIVTGITGHNYFDQLAIMFDHLIRYNNTHKPPSPDNIEEGDQTAVFLLQFENALKKLTLPINSFKEKYEAARKQFLDTIKKRSALLNQINKNNQDPQIIKQLDELNEASTKQTKELERLLQEAHDKIDRDLLPLMRSIGVTGNVTEALLPTQKPSS